MHLTKVGEHESAEAGLARPKLKLFYKATVWEPQTDKLVTNFMLDHGDGNKEQVTRLQAEIFSYVVYTLRLLSVIGDGSLALKTGSRICLPR